MKKTNLIGLILLIAFASGCAQQQAIKEIPKDKTTMEFTFANEAKTDAKITAHINGEKVYEDTLISAKNAGGYFGQEFTNKELLVPSQKFTLKLSEAGTGKEETIQVDPSKGQYLDVTFWNDKFTIDQTTKKQVRID